LSRDSEISEAAYEALARIDPLDNVLQEKINKYIRAKELDIADASAALSLSTALFIVDPPEPKQNEKIEEIRRREPSELLTSVVENGYSFELLRTRPDNYSIAIYSPKQRSKS
jgi:hypothetical protein